jgi:ABC-type dipeptide/oligopeptide/nickel transport system ATPase subunit
MNASANPNILALRPDFRAIARWIEPNSTVLDAGCGDGSLLRVLQDELDVQAYGIEIRDEGVLACAQKGVHVIQQDLSQTLQTIHNTAQVLRDTLRVGRECIVSFPNFGYWPHRLSVFRGRMPVSEALPYQWYNTPNVRVLTISDFEGLAPKVGLRVLDRVVMHEGVTVNWGENWRGSLAVYRVCAV